MEQVLWKESWINLVMESADAIRYVEGDRTIVVDNIEDLKNALGR